MQIRDISITKTTANDPDFLLMQNPTTGETYKITKANLLAGLSSTPTQPNSTKLTGTPFGLSPFWEGNQVYSFASVFDGNTGTFYNYANSNGGYCGLDLGSKKTITKVRYFPRNDFAGGIDRLVGGIFQISDTSDTNGYTSFFSIGGSPANGWNEAIIQNVSGRYFRYLSPNNSYGNIAEIEVYGY